MYWKNLPSDTSQTGTPRLTQTPSLGYTTFAQLKPFHKSMKAPIPFFLNESLPDFDDLDKEGNIWLWDDVKGKWEYVYIRTRTRAYLSNYSKWLPFYASPLKRD